MSRSTAGRRDIASGASVLPTLLALGVAMLCGISYLYFSWNLDRREAALDEIRNGLPFTLVELENALGYGGLIHEFKNWVLRPDEARYRAGAEAGADRALRALEQLDAINRRIGLDTDLDPQRETILAYRRNIDAVAAMHAAGASTAEIDAKVRISDDAALDAIDDLHRQIVDILSGLARELAAERRNVRLSAVLLLGALAIALALFIRERGRLRTALEQGRREEMEQFTRIAAHDIIGPLKQISALLEFAREDLRGIERDAVESADSLIERAAGRARLLDDMISAVFDYINIGSGGLNPARVSIAITAEELGRLYLPPAGELILEGDLPVVTIEPVEFDIVLRNLIANAVKHHPTDHPRIRIRYRRGHGFHAVEVEDDGAGIPQENRDKIFRMFWSGKALSGAEGEARKVSGIGLGLVRRIVQKWGGDIRVSAASPSGAIFTFTFPILTAPQETKRAGDPAAPP